MADTAQAAASLATWTPALRARVAVLAAAVSVLAALASSAFVARERSRLLEAWRRDLGVEATHQAAAVGMWFHERAADAEVLADSPTTRRALERRADADLEDLRRVLGRIRASYGYVEVFVLSAPELAVGSSPDIDLPADVPAVAAAMRESPRPFVASIDQDRHLAFAAPVPGTPTGAVVLEMDPQQRLRGLLASAPATETGETLLVHARGDEVIFASPRRHGRTPDLPLVLAAGGQGRLAAAAATRGVVGAGEYLDYRGQEVLAATRAVGPQGWGVVAKIDRDEALAPLAAYTRTAWALSGLAVFAFTALGAALLLRARTRTQNDELVRQREALALHRAEERNTRLGRVLDESSDEIYALSATTLRVLETNARARAATGYDAATLATLTMDAIEPEVRGRDLARHLEAAPGSGREVASYLAHHRRADGSTYPVDARLYRADGAESPVAVLIASDATARRSLEAQLVQAQKMEAVGRLAGGLAHDFNNLLTVVRISADALRTGLEPAHPLHADAEDVHQATVRAIELTRQLLTFSRKHVQRKETVDANEVLRGVLGLLRRAVREDVEVSLGLHDGPVWLSTDRAQLEQALLNLAVNSRDAMPTGGRLVLETRLCCCDDAPGEQTLPAERCALLRVSDTGEGIPPEALDKIFDPFFTTKPRGKGTGLGLAMVYSFVTQSGGAVQVRSEVGRGTTFDLYFPEAAPAVQPAAAPTPALEAPRGGETVLVVDDAREVRTVAARVLRAAGYAVIEASGGAEALLLFEQHAARIALVLTDVVMPQMGGRALAEALRAKRPALPVVFMSGYADDAALHADLDATRERFVAKPFGAEALAAVVRAALDAPAGGAATGPG